MVTGKHNNRCDLKISPQVTEVGGKELQPSFHCHTQSHHEGNKDLAESGTTNRSLSTAQEMGNRCDG